ncbi:transglycosylase domain-containing protein [Gracilibacillus salinarum]|uniref:Penicillin-binding protein n=1 Tax=Gracilibacillus salinarum TaxID=2932255 RepID=A0ABY4GSI5_9BACI|nr:transglycosylase domain-containing protein [Gracilibacillus salinarum]UOQ87105.1 penicillin-binding protein [Gracilibacillus salinarum]
MKLLFFLVMMAGSCLAVLLLASFLLGPPSLERPQNTIYYGNAEEVIGEEYGSEKRYWVSLAEIDDDLEKATIWTEDQHFYDHIGFDFKRLMSAVVKNITSFSLKEGASTITQQYARNLFLSHEKTWKRKLYEAFYTIRLEMYYDKDELLEGYLNTIYYGHGAYGIEAASKYYFNKSAEDLSWAEAAMLAGIPKGPSTYSPFHDEEKAKNRQRFILDNLYAHGVVDETTYQSALAEELAFSEDHVITTQSAAPYFQDVVVEELKQLLDVDMEKIRSGGYKVYTTLDMKQQQALEDVTARDVSNKEIEIGAMAMNPHSGAITALIGGQDYEASSFNRVTQAQRMPGSSFKPFLYYAALENGMTAATTLMSKPTSFELADGKMYQPSNYNDYYANEPITMAQALALSDNIFAVKTNLYLTPERFVRVVKDKFGFKSELDAVPALALGTEVVTMQEMVQGYGMIANGGAEVNSHTITKVTDAYGKVLYDREEVQKEDEAWSLFPKEDDKQVLDEAYTFILQDLMKGMFNHELDGYMQVTGSSIANQLTHEYAGKSGTTNSDNWMIGFSPSLVAGVWTGYDDNRDITKTNDKHFAKQVWADFMEAAHEDLPEEHVVKPDNVVEVNVDLNTGLLATEDCGQTHKMYFVKGTEPTKQCTLHLDDGFTPEHPDDLNEGIPDDALLENWWEWLWTGEDEQ